MRHLPLLLVTSLLLTACATGYQPRGKGEMGYYEKQLAPDRWEIGFNAQRQTDWATIDQYLGRRADELARVQGWKGYLIVAQNHETSTDTSNQNQSTNLFPGKIDTTTTSSSGSLLVTVYQIPYSYREGHLTIAPKP
jgi:hypothetical protein